MTSGNIPLSTTSFDRAKLHNATGYGPVNAWAFRRLLNDLNLPKSSHFADLGCGMGRACLLAAEYGFEKVTGVELAPELCTIARENVAKWRKHQYQMPPVEILEMDVLDFGERADADIFFMFRPFSLDFLLTVLRTLVKRAGSKKRKIVIIYCDRLPSRESYANALSMDTKLAMIHNYTMLGYSFYTYQYCHEHE
jgi:SAM-dependent methyltransferase